MLCYSLFSPFDACRNQSDCYVPQGSRLYHETTTFSNENHTRRYNFLSRFADPPTTPTVGSFGQPGPQVLFWQDARATSKAMATSRHRLRRTVSIGNAVLQVSMVLVALVSGGTDASAPPRGGSPDVAIPAAASSIPRNVLPRTGRDDPASAGGDSRAGPAGAAPDDFLTFCVNLDELPEQLAVSRDYRVVAVTGCQCSGKSTLLNALFGTG